MAHSRVDRRGAQRPAAEQPVARVCVDVSLAHLNRPFDYSVPEQLAAEAVPGCRVRVRFAGQLVDGFLLERAGSSEHLGRLAFIERVVSPEPVASPEIVALANAVADRYAGMLTDVLRLAIPPRHAKTEVEPISVGSTPPSPDVAGWRRYTRAEPYLDAVRTGRPAHGIWQALPGEDWPTRLAELAGIAASAGRGVVLVVPDYRDVARVHAACARLLGPKAVVALAADAGPAERYRRWLAVRRGAVRVAVGTRSTAFAPVVDPGLLVIWDDGDDLHAEPRAPYPHAREVLIRRAHLTGAALLIAGFARTAEAQLLIDTGWAHEIAAPSEQVRQAAPKVIALDERDVRVADDPAARTARLPSVAFAAARSALAGGMPVLIQVPRRGYVSALVCAQCRTSARCRHCAGPLSVPDGKEAGPLSCRWCGKIEAEFHCVACGCQRWRATVVGSRRTAEELGRAFSGVPVRTSGGDHVLAEVPAGPALVVATPGAEPVAPAGYGAVLLLDTWALLGRADLRATEETFRRWLAAAALARSAQDGGQVVVVADAGLPPVQALTRWAPAWHAARELAARVESRFPPAVILATIDGGSAALAAFFAHLTLPDTVEVLGPVQIPGTSANGSSVHERLLLRIPRNQGRTLVNAITQALAVRAARKEPDQIRVRIDPLDIV